MRLPQREASLKARQQERAGGMGSGHIRANERETPLPVCALLAAGQTLAIVSGQKSTRVELAAVLPELPGLKVGQLALAYGSDDINKIRQGKFQVVGRWD